MSKDLPEAQALKQIFRRGKQELTRYLRVDDQSIAGCTHQGCSCVHLITGNCEELSGYEYKLPTSNMHAACHEWARDFMSRYTWQDGKIVSGSTSDPSLVHLVAGLAGTNVNIIRPPMGNTKFMTEKPVETLSPDIEKIVRVADTAWLRHKTGYRMTENFYHQIFSEESKKGEEEWTKEKARIEKAPKLIDLVAKSFGVSMWQIVWGKRHGYPHWTARGEGLYPTKAPQTILKNAALTDRLPAVRERDQARSSGDKLKEECAQAKIDKINSAAAPALEWMYQNFGTRKDWGTCKMGMNYEGLDDRYLAASAALKKGRESQHQLNPTTRLKVSVSGKKYENHLPDLDAVLAFIANPDNDPFTVYQTWIKEENAMHPGKNWTPKAYEENLLKARTFVAPSSVYAAMEILVGQRMKFERGRVIRIGSSWKHGGADALAYALGIRTILEALEPVMVEGDVTNFDQRVLAHLTNMYLSFGLIYDDPDDPWYPQRRLITEYLIRHMMCRIVHLLGPVWAIQTGGVPSGCQNTSHMDSWVMAFWFFSFLLRADVQDDCRPAASRFPAVYASPYSYSRVWRRPSL